MSNESDAPLVLVAAGGTGGHLFPAEALSIELAKRNVAVELATDERAQEYGGKFPARATHIIPSASLRGRNPLSYARTGAVIAFGTLKAWQLIGRIKPAVIVGFGGYPTIPPLLAASLRAVPTVMHEQNGVMGRANRLLAPRVTAIATSFRQVAYADAYSPKMAFTGNPVRPAVIAAASIPYAAPDAAGPLRLVVFGGSQGAQIMSQIVPAAVERLSPALRARLQIVQQARAEDLAQVRDIYSRLNVKAEAAAFFPDLPARMAAGHLIIARSGATTVAELAAVGRPAILVPLPHALDQDQRANAGVLEKAGGAIRVDQKDFTPGWLSGEIARLAADPARLAGMTKSARTAGTLDAAGRLADLILKVAGLPPR